MNRLSEKVNIFFSKVSLQDQILFAKHLAIMLQSGMPILDSLTMLKKQRIKSKTFSEILEQLSLDIDRGQFLSTSLERHRNVFGDLFINVVRVGEASGTLPENLNYLVEELTKKQMLNKKIKGAMVYPMIVLTAVLGIVGILIFVVFPKILPLFASLRIKLPLATRLLLAAYDFISKDWLSMLLGGLLIFAVFSQLMKIEKIKFCCHYLLLKTPFLGGMITNINMANLTRTLSILLRSGVKIVESVETSANTLPNLVYKNEFKKAAKELTGGGQISQCLFKKPEIFPSMLSQMIEVGENTGNLSQTLLYLSDFYENEVDEIAKNLSTTLEPLLLIIMGMLVGFVALAIILPIYGITQYVSQ